MKAARLMFKKRRRKRILGLGGGLNTGSRVRKKKSTESRGGGRGSPLRSRAKRGSNRRQESVIPDSSSKNLVGKKKRGKQDESKVGLKLTKKGGGLGAFFYRAPRNKKKMGGTTGERKWVKKSVYHQRRNILNRIRGNRESKERIEPD